MLWQFYLLIFLVLGGASDILRRRLAVSIAKHNRLVHAFFFVCVLYPSGIITALILGGNLRISWVDMLILLVAGGFFPMINLLSYKANKGVDAGLYTLLNNLTPIVTIIAATIFLNEGLTGHQMLGAAIVIGSAFLATVPKVMNRSITKTAGLGYALLSVLLLGLGVVFERWMLVRVDISAYLVYGWGGQTLWMVALAWGDRKHVRECRFFRDRKLLMPILGFALTSALKSIAFIGALQVSGNASLVSAVASFLCVFVILMAFIFLKEKDHLGYKVAAAIVGSVGLIILNI